SCTKLNLMKGRILILDDDREFTIALRDQLKAAGHEVLAEINSRSGVEVAESFSPSVIITDSANWGSDAFPLLSQIRSSQTQVPIILAGKQSSIETALRAVQEEGAYHYFEKPVDFEKLRVVVERAVELSEARRDNEI